jgi:zinc/manganese transport system substrate-binding protein
VRAGDVLGLELGANPHVWYSAGYVDAVNAAILAQLKRVNPDATAYFDDQAVATELTFTTYRHVIGEIASRFGDTPVAATESIFVDMAYATRLKLVTPPEFMSALSQGNDPSARDIAIFQDQLRNRQVRVLVYNVQTVTPTTEQLKQLAQQNGIPIVGVSETMPASAQTFQDWQSVQLQQLLAALEAEPVSP